MSKDIEEIVEKYEYKAGSFSPVALVISSPTVEELIKQAHQQGVRECIKLSDEIESREPDGGTEQWKAFKCFRNTMRDTLQSGKTIEDSLEAIK